MISIVLVSLFALAVASAPWLGAERNDGSSENARPVNGWFPAEPIRG